MWGRRRAPRGASPVITHTHTRHAARGGCPPALPAAGAGAGGVAACRSSGVVSRPPPPPPRRSENPAGNDAPASNHALVPRRRTAPVRTGLPLLLAPRQLAWLLLRRQLRLRLQQAPHGPRSLAACCSTACCCCCWQHAMPCHAAVAVCVGADHDGGSCLRQLQQPLAATAAGRLAARWAPLLRKRRACWQPDHPRAASAV